MTDLCDLDAVEQRDLVRSGKASARELLASHLARIEAVNPTVNAVVALDPEVGQRRAAAVDDAIARGEDPGLLAGLVTAHKDLAETVDFPTSYGSPVLAGTRPGADALLVARMAEAGAVAVGKTNVPEFGAGSHTFNPVYGTTLNPWNTGLSAGGSSGGAAVALATRMVAVADGSDFGGSLRNPANWNNVVGFRNTAGAVPAGGPGIGWHPMPVMGAMGRTVDDLTLLLRVLCQPSLADPLGRGLELPDEITPTDRPLRVAYSPTLGGLPVADDVAAVIAAAARTAADLGWEVVEDEPDFRGADEAFITLRAFNYTVRARMLARHKDRIKQPLVEEIERGAALSATEVAEAFARLKTLWDRGVAFFDRYDLLLAPVSQISPFPAEWEYPTEVAGTTMTHYIEWMLSCCRITALGTPALSLPVGFTDDGMPVGAQLIGQQWDDVTVLRAAKALEVATGVLGRRFPPVG